MAYFPLPELAERLAFLEFSPKEAALVKRYRRALLRAVYPSVEAFYQHLSKFPELQSLLRSEPTLLGHLKKTQRRYWQRLVSGKYDLAYAQDRLRIGIAHQRAGLNLKWYTASYAWFLARLLPALCLQPELDLAQKLKLCGALLKLVFFDLSLAVDTYLAADLAQIEKTKREFERIFTTVPDAILTFDAHGRIETANPAACRLFRQAPAGLALPELLASQGKALTPHRLLEALWHPSAPLEAEIISTKTPVEVTVTQFPNEGLPRYLAVVRDLSRQKRAEAKLIEAKLIQLAQFDPLTALPNRALFLDRLAQELARAHRYQRLVAVLFLDLDDFKKINDSFGHLVGDTLLKQVALRLKSAVRETDTIARFGGDEFVLCVADLQGPEDYLPIVNKLLEVFKASFRLQTQEVFVKASLGIALFPHHGTDPHTLLKHADAAMYEAKHKHLGHYCYNAGLGEAAIQKITLEKELHRALEREEFYLLYQPQVDFQGRLLGVEALLRWRNPSLGEVSPSRFIPHLEACGLIHSVGEWILATACRQLLSLQERLSQELILAVNLSAPQVARPDFPEQVFQSLGLRPNCLELEITEHLLMESSEVTLGNLETLCALGIRLAIDDFGTGYSSLGYLKSFPFHTLKIDKSFIHHLTTAKDLALARHIVEIGKSLEMCVVAEGVETKAQFHLVQELGCDRIQGYFFSPPVEPKELIQLAARTMSEDS